ncbi:MAG: hypothetical protein DRJ35_05270 [Thermoprotei archaeon]|nr:MAG: hypothetical protein DRJ35_05270 [Thermoprotei archaeon]
MCKEVAEEFAYHIVVTLILNGRIEEAILELSKFYKVRPPKIFIKRPKGLGKALAVYVPRKEAIYLTRGEYIYNPFIILHEFYHHLRYFGGKHRGTEKNADRFANCFLVKYKKYLSRRLGSKQNNL